LTNWNPQIAGSPQGVSPGLGALRVPPPPKRTLKQKALIALGILMTIGALMSAGFVWWGLRGLRSITFVSVPEVTPAASGAPANWLLVGSDSREGIDPNSPGAGAFLGETVEGKRTDTIMLARVDPGAKTIDLMSVPRDLWVPLAGKGENGRVNSAFNGDGGDQRLVATVEQFFGIEINNYAEINFVGFQAIIDSMGGVPIWFENPMRDGNSGLDIPSQGCHVLDGYQALAFVRARHLQEFRDGSWKSDPTGDLGRTARQQLLISRVGSTATSKLDISNLGTVDAIIQAGGQHLLIDDGAGAGDLLGLARTFASVGGAGIQRHSLPVEGFRTSGGASVLRLLDGQAQDVVKIFQGRGLRSPGELPSDDSVPRDSFTIQVQNGAGIGGLAGSTRDSLAAAGFQVSGVADAPSNVDQTVIVYPSGSEAQASELARALAVGPQFRADDSVSEVVMVLGADFDGLAAAGSLAGATVEAEEEAVAPAAVQQAGEHEVGVVPGPGPEGTECS